jgi:His-Xaa-Ser system protein HxsD
VTDEAASPPRLDVLTYRVEARSVEFTVDEELYPRSAIYGAAYLFVARCFVFLARAGAGAVAVRLKTREAADEAALDALAGEFANELLNQSLRDQIARSTAPIREYYMARAFAAQESHASIDALLAELDKEELEEASLEIRVPWEKPHG